MCQMWNKNVDFTRSVLFHFINCNLKDFVTPDIRFHVFQ